jgi:methionyl-tRNA synthetase
MNPGSLPVRKRTMMTSALPYANGPIHVGHIAGAYLPADIHARYLRSSGQEVLWICGSDEHGAAITMRARKDGKTPREVVDKYHEEMQEAFRGLDISFDHYSRTSSPKHHAVAQEFFLKLLENDAFEVKTEAQFYDAQAGTFLADRYITGTCPKCHQPGAYGDQCEKCGAALSPTDLIDPTSTLSGATPELRDTTLWYLPMGRHEHWLRAYIENGVLDGQPHHDPSLWKAHVVGQCRSWIDSGLESRAMTRDLDWGVPVPLPDAEGKVLYVWLDAPIGYITATMEWCEANGQDWRRWWQDSEAQLFHFIGKDNIVFHCLIFPILLKAHGDFNLPTQVPANAFMNLEGDKISTSRNWAVWVAEFLEEFPERSDEMRYVLASIMPEQKDSEFTWSDYRDRVNNELADVLGNFVNRVVVLTQKFCQGFVPTLPVGVSPEAADLELQDALGAAAQNIGDAIERFRYRDALQEAMGLIRHGNKYLTELEPWKQIKTDQNRALYTLYWSIQVAGAAGVLLAPFLPRTAKRIAEAFSVDQKHWGDCGSPIVAAGMQLSSLPILFQKVEEETVIALKARLGHRPESPENPSTPTEPPVISPAKPPIAFEDFSKLDLRVGEVIACERVPKADKLLRLTIRTGLDERTVLSGIAEHFQPEEVLGRKVTLLANLAPRTIRGIESQGMVLLASTASGGLRFVTPEEGCAAGDIIS